MLSIVLVLVINGDVRIPVDYFSNMQECLDALPYYQELNDLFAERMSELGSKWTDLVRKSKTYYACEIPTAPRS